MHFLPAIFFNGVLIPYTWFFNKSQSWAITTGVLLVAGLVGAWVVDYTGPKAGTIISSQICGPLVVKGHEGYSGTVAWLFTAFVLLFGYSLVIIFKRFTQVIAIFTFIWAFIVSGFLIYTGRSGLPFFLLNNNEDFIIR